MKVFFASVLSVLGAALLSSCVYDHPLNFQSVDLIGPLDGAVTSYKASDVMLRRWNVLGPIAWTKGQDIQTEVVPDEAHLSGLRDAPEGAVWVTRTFGVFPQQGGIDFGAVYTEKAAARSYFYATGLIRCDSTLNKLSMRAGAAGPFKVWLNGVEVLCSDKPGDKWTAADITLNRGYNMVVMKVLDPSEKPRARRLFLLFRDEQGRDFFYR